MPVGSVHGTSPFPPRSSSLPNSPASPSGIPAPIPRVVQRSSRPNLMIEVTQTTTTSITRASAQWPPAEESNSQASDALDRKSKHHSSTENLAKSSTISQLKRVSKGLFKGRSSIASLKSAARKNVVQEGLEHANKPQNDPTVNESEHSHAMPHISQLMTSPSTASVRYDLVDSETLNPSERYAKVPRQQAVNDVDSEIESFQEASAKKGADNDTSPSESLRKRRIQLIANHMVEGDKKAMASLAAAARARDLANETSDGDSDSLISMSSTWGDADDEQAKQDVSSSDSEVKDGVDESVGSTSAAAEVDDSAHNDHPSSQEVDPDATVSPSASSNQPDTSGNVNTRRLSISDMIAEARETIYPVQSNDSAVATASAEVDVASDHEENRADGTDRVDEASESGSGTAADASQGYYVHPDIVEFFDSLEDGGEQDGEDTVPEAAVDESLTHNADNEEETVVQGSDAREETLVEQDADTEGNDKNPIDSNQDDTSHQEGTSNQEGTSSYGGAQAQAAAPQQAPAQTQNVPHFIPAAVGANVPMVHDIDEALRAASGILRILINHANRTDDPTKRASLQDWFVQYGHIIFLVRNRYANLIASINSLRLYAVQLAEVGAESAMFYAGNDAGPHVG